MILIIFIAPEIQLVADCKTYSNADDPFRGQQHRNLPTLIQRIRSSLMNFMFTINIIIFIVFKLMKKHL